MRKQRKKMDRENNQENAYKDLEGFPQSLRFQDSGRETPRSSSRKGGWITAPFLIGSASAATVALFGVTTDLLVYVDKKYHIQGIKLAQMTNTITALISLAPVAGAVICDSFLGCFRTISISLLLSFMGTLALTLTAVIPSLAPSPCGLVSSSCTEPSATQFVILCCVYALVALGAAGTSYIYIALGADQFDKAKDQEAFVNGYFFATTLATLISYTVVVYILDNVGWDWGYGLCMVLNGVGLVMILLGRGRYLDVRPQGSPFVSIARVVVGASRKMKISLSPNEEDYYSGTDHVADGVPKHQPLTPGFRFLNRAAVVMKGDVDVDGKLAKPWRLCTIQQVEDLKKLLKLLPLWSTGIYLMVSFGVQVTLTTLQVLAMDRRLGPHFKIPAASFQVFPFLSMTIFLPIIDRFFYPLLQRIPSISPSLLHRIGTGHVVAIASFVSMAVVEASRLHMMHSRGLGSEQTSALLLVPALLLNGIASAFFIPGQLSLYYQEFPESLKATGTAMMSLTTGIGFYLGAPVLGAIRRATGWLPDDVNEGRLDNVYWALGVLGVLNFLYYLVCAKAYKLKARSTRSSFRESL